MQIAEKIRQQRPSRYADSVVYSLYMSLADQSMREIPAYQAAVDKTKLSLGEFARIGWALVQDDKLVEQMVDDPNLKAAYAIKAEHVDKLPGNHSAYDWAILQAFDPERAAKVKNEIVASDGREFKELMSSKAFNPIGASSVITEYLLNRMLGEDAKADAVLAAAKAENIPLP